MKSRKLFGKAECLFVKLRFSEVLNSCKEKGGQSKAKIICIKKRKKKSNVNNLVY